MSNVKVNFTWSRSCDNARNLFYSLIPVILVASIWSVAWANSMEARVKAMSAPPKLQKEGQLMTRHGELDPHLAGSNPRPYVASLADPE